LRYGIAEAAKSQTNLHARIGLRYEISKVEDTSTHCVKFCIPQFDHRELSHDHDFPSIVSRKVGNASVNLALILKHRLT
jgi:hypothetical protein